MSSVVPGIITLWRDLSSEAHDSLPQWVRTECELAFNAYNQKLAAEREATAAERKARVDKEDIFDEFARVKIPTVCLMTTANKYSSPVPDKAGKL